jgi:biopolymer transport protein ExbD
MAKRKKIKIPKPELNITAMMDLVLNLIMFFVLVANFASSQLPAVEPPKPDASAAKASKGANKVVVNLLAQAQGDSWQVSHVEIAKARYEVTQYPALTDFIAEEKRRQPNIEIYLRADKRLTYADVQPVMMAIVGGGVAKINVVAKSSDQ